MIDIVIMDPMTLISTLIACTRITTNSESHVLYQSIATYSNTVHTLNQPVTGTRLRSIGFEFELERVHVLEPCTLS